MELRAIAPLLIGDTARVFSCPACDHRESYSKPWLVAPALIAHLYAFQGVHLSDAFCLAVLN